MKHKNVKNIGLMVIVSALTAVICFFAFKQFLIPKNEVYLHNGDPMKVQYVNYQSDASAAAPTDFTEASNMVVPVTVHITTKTKPKEVSSGGSRSPFGDPFSDFFGGGGGRGYSPGRMGSGSGVIISSDGYIMTNNHVIDGANDILVTLDNGKKYKGKIVGADPSTDLAVLKIEAEDLPSIVFGNSDDVQIGQWVLASGFPLNLQSTVTAGIISAKSRDLGVNDEGINPIESYLQTDAAVNPGNSGGPLVNTAGQLIGINSAIATPTGSFAGYAYAVPSNLVRKVANDIMKYGKVQRAFLGIYMNVEDDKRGLRAMTAAFKEDSDETEPGVVIADVTDGGSAVEAGLQKGDRIIGLNQYTINSQTDLRSNLARFRPGEKVTITYMRGNKENKTSVTLKNKDGNTAIVKNTVIDALGAEFVSLEPEQAQRMGISGGVLVHSVYSGLIKNQTDMKKGFVIVRVGNDPVESVDDLKQAIERQGNNVMIRGFYPGYSGMMYYAIHDIKSAMVN